jgi:Helix-loop-helix DNA-binding domain
MTFLNEGQLPDGAKDVLASQSGAKDHNGAEKRRKNIIRGYVDVLRVLVPERSGTERRRTKLEVLRDGKCHLGDHLKTS